MYDLTIEDYFAAAHSLREYNGNCENLHGHNWKIEVIVQAKKLDSLGLGIDFRILHKKIKETLALLDHKYLNELDAFKKQNPSTENISRFIYMDLKDKLKEFKNIRLKKVTSWEEAYAGASYYE